MISTVKAALEAEYAAMARAPAEQASAERGEDEQQVAAAGDEAEQASAVPDKAQRSFTDSDARILKTSDGSFQHCYNAKAIVDKRPPVVLAGALRQSGADCPALPAMLELLCTTLTAAGIDGLPRTLLAGAGYFSADNIAAALAAGIDPLIATGQLKHGQQPAMRHEAGSRRA